MSQQATPAIKYKAANINQPKKESSAILGQVTGLSTPIFQGSATFCHPRPSVTWLSAVGCKSHPLPPHPPGQFKHLLFLLIPSLCSEGKHGHRKQLAGLLCGDKQLRAAVYCLMLWARLDLLGLDPASLQARSSQWATGRWFQKYFVSSYLRVDAKERILIQDLPRVILPYLSSFTASSIQKPNFGGCCPTTVFNTYL